MKSKKIVLCAVSILFFQCNQVKKPDLPIARVTYLTGTAVRFIGATEKQLVVGDFLNEGEAIKTGANSTAELFIKGQGIVRLSEKTEASLVSLQEDAKNRVDIQAGAAAFFLKKMDRKGEFTVNAPTALAGVRGTTFMVSVENPNATKISVYDGAVAAQNSKGKEVILEKQAEVTIIRDSDLTSSAVRPLSKESLAALKKLAVFQRNNIKEYNALLDQIKGVESLKGIVIQDTVSDKFAQLNDETSRPEVAERVRSADENTIKHDTSQDPLKIKPNKTY